MPRFNLAHSNSSAVVGLPTLLDRTLVHRSVPPQQCWYSFAAEYSDANWGK